MPGLLQTGARASRLEGAASMREESAARATIREVVSWTMVLNGGDGR